MQSVPQCTPWLLANGWLLIRLRRVLVACPAGLDYPASIVGKKALANWDMQSERTLSQGSSRSTCLTGNSSNEKIGCLQLGSRPFCGLQALASHVPLSRTAGYFCTREMSVDFLLLQAEHLQCSATVSHSLGILCIASIGGMVNRGAKAIHRKRRSHR